MEIVIGTHALGLGGSETYALTLAEQLRRLGHGVVVCAAGIGTGGTVARESGIEVVALDDYDPGHCDGLIAQDRGMAFELRRRHPRAPLLFVAHSEEFDEQLPPRLSGLAGAVIVLNDRVERRVQALARDLRVVRMRQPIDVSRFRPRSRPAHAPRRLLMFGNNLDGSRLELVSDVAAHAGLELVRVGAKGEPTAHSEQAIDNADIVMGYGRCVLEGMACGRPSYVYDHLGGDGWVTADSYPLLERDGFGGRASEDVLDADRMLADLRRYDAAMGLVNRDLVVGRHRAEHHAQEVVALLRSLDPSDNSRADALGELGALVRAQWAARARIDQLEEQLRGERRATQEARDAHDALRGTTRYRVGAALAWPLDRMRQRSRR